MAKYSTHGIGKLDSKCMMGEMDEKLKDGIVVQEIGRWEMAILQLKHL
jgi:hypothetical protein